MSSPKSSAKLLVFRRHFLPALPALLLFWALVFWFFGQSLARDGEFTYALDDSYIHLALAKNLGFHGVWGVSPLEWASASSSLAWTTLLAVCLRTGGDHALFPLFLNLFFGSCCILTLAHLLRRGRLSPLWISLVAAFLVFAAPMPTLAVAGLEHLFHILVTLLFLSRAADILSEAKTESTRRRCFIFCGIAALLPMLRYEGLFAIGAAFLFLLWQRRAGLAALMLICAIFPLAVFGAISVHQGSLPFPNSVFLKVQTEAPNALFDHFSTRILYWIVNLQEVRILFIALALASLAHWTARRHPNEAEITVEKRRGGWLLALFLLMFGFHLQFARWGWLFRYEAYLIVSGGWILSLAARDYWCEQREKTNSNSRIRPFLIFPPALGLLFVALLRGWEAQDATPRAMNHVHDQQIQMARFFRRYFRSQSVAANDIGAVSYWSDVKLLDLYGIASRDVFEAKRAHRYTRDALTEIAKKHDVQVAALYPNWFVPGGQSGIPSGAGEILPRNWKRVGTWRLGELGFGSDVAFYAANPRAEMKLIAALRDFSSQLPRTQKQSGLYRQSEGE